MSSKLLTLFAVFACVVTTPSILSAQQYAKLSGTVISDALRKPIPRALIEIVGGPSIRTDDRGKFELIIELTGRNNIRLRASTDDDTYTPLEQVLSPKEHVGLDIKLTPAPASIRIVSPEPNEQIPCGQVMVRGTSYGLHQISTKLNIYVFVHPMGSGSKWVQPNFGPPAQDGSWQQVTALGGLDEFEIWAIATEETITVAEYPLSQELPAVVVSNTIRIRRIM